MGVPATAVLYISLMHSIPVDADPKACFKVGQVVVCRVVACDPSKEKLQLSLEVRLLNRSDRGWGVVEGT